MLRPGMLLALSPTCTFVNTLLRTDFAFAGILAHGGLAPPVTGLSPARRCWARCVKKVTPYGSHPLLAFSLFETNQAIDKIDGRTYDRHSNACRSEYANLTYKRAHSVI